MIRDRYCPFCDKVQAENARLRAALELLADPANWKPHTEPAVRVKASEIAYRALYPSAPGE